MKRDLRRTIEADGHHGRAGADRRVAGHVSVFPRARAEGSRQRGVKREGDAAGEANLPPMRMPAQQQIESSTRGLPEEAGHCLLAHIRMQIAQMQDPEAVEGLWNTVRD